MPGRRQGGIEPKDRSQPKLSHARLEQQRELLRRRMDCLAPTVKASSGWKTARALLGAKYLRADLTARIAILDAAGFLIGVLEMLPPL